MAPSYFTRYANLAFEHTDDGVLTMRFHTDGGPITFTGGTHEDLPKALDDIAHDPGQQGSGAHRHRRRVRRLHLRCEPG